MCVPFLFHNLIFVKQNQMKIMFHCVTASWPVSKLHCRNNNVTLRREALQTLTNPFKSSRATKGGNVGEGGGENMVYLTAWDASNKLYKRGSSDYPWCVGPRGQSGAPGPCCSFLMKGGGWKGSVSIACSLPQAAARRAHCWGTTPCHRAPKEANAETITKPNTHP